MKLEVKPLTPARWKDVELLFGPRGACGGCWCMSWRLEKGERLDDIKGPQAKRRFKRLVQSGKAQGFLAYLDGEPVGWLAAGPRRDFPKLDRAPSFACDDAPRVHSLPCFFIKRGHRGKGVASALLSHAVKALTEEGAQILEGYPARPFASGAPIPAAFAWTGTMSLFTQHGFRPVSRRTGKQRMRLSVG